MGRFIEAYLVPEVQLVLAKVVGYYKEDTMDASELAKTLNEVAPDSGEFVSEYGQDEGCINVFDLCDLFVFEECLNKEKTADFEFFQANTNTIARYLANKYPEHLIQLNVDSRTFSFDSRLYLLHKEIKRLKKENLKLHARIESVENKLKQ